MTASTGNKFTVGLHVGGARHSVTVTAEDALMAALKVKLEQPAAAINFVRRCNKRGDLQPAAAINFVRRCNKRGDLRHPHEAVADPAGQQQM